jgi:tetratricopeptide (TPR) repeat protein
MSTDWFRNTTWNEAVERTFNDNLRRTKRKQQYLRIQASTLAQSHPEVTLRLLDQYFELNDDFERAQAYVDRARALLELGRLNEAIDSYNAALAREAEFPQLQTQAYVDLPYLIATNGIREKYDRAVQLLEKYEARLAFPVERFRWHAAYALIAAETNDAASAKVHAQSALEAAALDHSGFRYHPKTGLVSEAYDDIVRKLKEYSRRH